ncbi:MAG: methyltransferase domain-containing protein [Leptospiraceae bacterium]|nr:methyltransferase domain-containing protein [Leptospiraceae bacterium]
MDKETIDYYNNNYEVIYHTYIQAKEGGIKDFFHIAFPSQNSKILDIGAGSGRDLLYLLQKGYDAYGIDASSNLIDYVKSKHSNLEKRLLCNTFPTEDIKFNFKFDGIILAAVLMHIPKEELINFVYNIKENLNDNGRLLLSIPNEREVDSNYRDENNRLFYIYDPSFVQLLFERAGFQLTSKWNSGDSLGRQNLSWTTLIFELKYSSKLRPLDKIEQVLNRDSKTATYKFALLRSLCDISVNSLNSVQWLKGNIVGITIDLIVERWIKYYWFLFEETKFIPQHNAESKDNIKIAFRNQLSELMNKYKKSGGYSAYLDKRFEDTKEIDLLRRKIRYTIVEGPIKHSGTHQEEKFFSYDSNLKALLIPSDLWIEICLMNYWIEDALVLRWAELSVKMSKGELEIGFILQALLKEDYIKRDVELAKQIYKQNENYCVWTDKKLGSSFDVDHIIPYSLWHNNNLWNLVPTDPKINRQKSDKLPHKSLLTKRKDKIISNWELLNQNYPTRFQNEVISLLGKSNILNNWENKLFSSLVESIEITAMQRGIERWGL